jgi:hypothetical protein
MPGAPCRNVHTLVHTFNRHASTILTLNNVLNISISYMCSNIITGSVSSSSAFAKELERAKGSVLGLHDVVLWGGDLNYRINGTPGAVKHLIDSGMAEVSATYWNAVVLKALVNSSPRKQGSSMAEWVNPFSARGACMPAS